MKILIASGNNHKVEEFNQLFADLTEVSFVAAPEKLEVEEDGATYFENAYKKADAYYKKFQCPVLSDDSGLDVETLPDDLGIKSARFGGSGLDDKGRAMLLLKKLDGNENRKAKFTCVLCLYLSEDEQYFFEGHVPGEIGKQYRGNEGFGYDPVFIPLKGQVGATLAEQSEWKMKNSHRAAASKFLMDFFQTNICQNSRNSL